MTKKVFISTAAALVAGLIVCVIVFRAPTGTSGNKLRIGAAIALTGYGAPFGENERNVIALLQEQYPDIVIVVEDTRSDPAAGVSAIRKLIEVDKVDVVYCDLTTVVNAGLPLTNDAKKVMIAAVYLDNLLTRSPHAIRNLPRGIDESRALLEKLSKDGVVMHKVAALGSNDDFGRSSITDFRIAAREYKADVSLEDVIPENPQAMGSLAQKVVAHSPDVVYAASLLPNVGMLIKELRIANYKGPIITTDAFAAPYMREGAGDYAKGVIYVDFPATAAAKEMDIAFRQKFGKGLIPAGAFCYDGLQLLIGAYSDAGSRDAERLVKAMEGRKREGLYGSIEVRNREVLYPLMVRSAE